MRGRGGRLCRYLFPSNPLHCTVIPTERRNLSFYCPLLDLFEFPRSARNDWRAPEMRGRGGRLCRYLFPSNPRHCTVIPTERRNLSFIVLFSIFLSFLAPLGMTGRLRR